MSIENQKENSAPSKKTSLLDNGTPQRSFSQGGKIALALATLGIAISSLTEQPPASAGASSKDTPTPTPSSRLILAEGMPSQQSFIKNAEVIRAAKKTEILSQPANPIYWTDSLGRNRRTSFINASFGIPPNNPDRLVGTIYDWIDVNVPSETNYTLRYQLWEGLYPETQAGTGVYLAILRLLADGTTNKEYPLTAVMASQDGELLKFSIEAIQTANNPTDYSHTGRKRFNDVLSQQGIHLNGIHITSYQFGFDTSNRKYIEISYYNVFVPAEKGTEWSYLDSNGNLLPFTIVESTPEPTRTATPQPSATATPTVTFRAFNLYLPMVQNKYQAGK